MTLSVAPRLARKARLRWDPYEQKYLLLYPERGLALNEAAHAVVSLCDGRHDPNSISRILTARFATMDPGEMRKAVSVFLERLETLGLVEYGVPPSK